ncbi:hypothetical protein PV327_009486 [Microctonus hyperodae]|uniref:Enoyl-[acyl-carrier-protein] reductase, mitochondrial n=1 Tax=Microctonus hyperodae TaxID=165561 RepID=A0AA39FUK6_MICHY|nr:hypothetical protein PV327_009486 [Microctonus hyperodae]
MVGCFTKLLFNFTKNVHKHQIHRSMVLSSQKYGKSLVYKSYGEPSEVLNIVEAQNEKPKTDEIAVRWLLAPVNPADINTIQGKYPSRPSLPAIPGNEGVGEVIEIGANIKEFAVGDRVIPNDNNMGTWRTNALYKANDLLKIPKSFGDVEASMLNVNPCTAYRMLKDYVSLKPGDTVIQNGGNSAVGQFVIQLCKAWKLNSVNIVRDRTDIMNLKEHLTMLGANEVLTENELRTTDLFKSKKCPSPKLALNCVSGQSGVEILRHVGINGTMVTYGGMSREPVIVPVSALIFKNIMIKGFWMTAWTKENSKSKIRTEMFNDLADLFASKKLKAPPYKLIPFLNYQEAVSNALKIDGKTGVKYILDMSV